ncbi:putative lysine decarboxylase [Blyttiomyces helicus]|uniref:Putative lysine decarboxylase n=1 Tax=Blyttiomyces helicus TaxID=388810 RepID=A0A4P9W7I1_9FUNG|nr:putative lysine decarboxylase [Blyttiomyces helicus]|eukprot:RKO88421.1 putative lysine decarboxylase [Blyttiomyces helicus]
MPVTSLCVFCGSSSGRDPIYAKRATEFGAAMVKGAFPSRATGGNNGLMGAVAKAVEANGGNIRGFIPETMQQFEDMHTRKQKMSAAADGFVALPGGFGTFEELLEMITWSQLNIHSKPIGILNVAGFFDPLLDLVRRGIDEGFIRPMNIDLVVVREDPVELLKALQDYKLPEGSQYALKWEKL